MLLPFLAPCLVFLLAVSVAVCTPYHAPASLRPRDIAGVVRGVNTTDENGHVYVRREIRDLKENHADQWNLYLLALERLQGSDQEDPYSYYGLAGIHGRPYQVWQGAPGLTHKLGAASYCPHSNELFLGWHRPYLALFEQVLHAHMQEIAATAPVKEAKRFAAAAQSFRMPYWDWGLGGAKAVVPEFFMQKSIRIVELDGVETMMRNPLYAYRFHPLVPGDFTHKWMGINETVRWPDSDNFTAPSRQEVFAQTFIEQSTSLISGIETAFRASNFSGWAKQLEDPHGWMHGIIGGGWDETQNKTKYRGHMWPLEYSAFEPLFMLHHTNVDRLWALFQALKPNVTMGTSNIGPNGNVFLENHQLVNDTTSLLPFRRANGAFWQTRDTYDTRVLGYAYPETQAWDFASTAAYRAHVTSAVATLYGSKTRALLLQSKNQVTGGLLGASLHDDDTFTDWTIEFAVAPVDVGAWTRLTPATHERATTSVGRGQKGVLAERATGQDVVRGTTGLTTHLLDQIQAGQLESLGADHVVPFLRERLVWKVLSGTGNVITGPSLSALTIQVASSKAHIPEDPGALVEYGKERKRYPEITRGKPGGGAA
ncbi:similar to tyrosinase [Plenodomus lingam JN3]|uniref:tyrosinase n=1 Tax=Leptosphaeria maculans (strain JN3 / isolate v23.1.3 / race Av1-4-5-6-7-8) TaxID=985895 RepID=E4ZW06_LEPMJ|nr:similar to tyrosinase [Plenodomus lingam JN3]CBX95782.1 similar to tyrosinase [Plenodomus lingam JN3]